VDGCPYPITMPCVRVRRAALSEAFSNGCGYENINVYRDSGNGSGGVVDGWLGLPAHSAWKRSH
jgi:hypothetical protein